MPSVYHDKKGWIASFKGVGHKPGDRQRQIRVSVDQLDGAVMEADQRAKAQEFADSLDQACRSLETGDTPLEQVQRAAQAGAITEDQAKAILGGETPGPAVKPRALTLQLAAEKHPATQRMPLAQRWRYINWLTDFEKFSGITTCKGLTLDAVQKYIKHREKAGDAYDTRRHRLLFLRRASKYGTTAGIPDQLAAFSLDRRSGRTKIDTWSLDEFADVALALEAIEKWDVLAAIGLGMGVGLRPSETYRIELPDFDDDALEVGKKNKASERTIPLPKTTVLRWVEKVAASRKTGPLFLHSKGAAFNEDTWAKWLRREFAAAGLRKLKAKELRKSFATWAVRAAIDRTHIEAFLGHDDALMSKVTARHYLRDWLVTELRPTAKKIDGLIAEAIKSKRDKRAG